MYDWHLLRRFVLFCVVFVSAYAHPALAMLSGQANAVAQWCYDHREQSVDPFWGQWSKDWVDNKLGFWKGEGKGCDSTEPNSATGWCEAKRYIQSCLSYYCPFTNYPHGPYTIFPKTIPQCTQFANGMGAQTNAGCNKYDYDYRFTGSHCAVVSAASCNDPSFIGFCNDMNAVQAKLNRIEPVATSLQTELSDLNTTNTSLLEQSINQTDTQSSILLDTTAINSATASLRDTALKDSSTLIHIDNTGLDIKANTLNTANSVSNVADNTLKSIDYLISIDKQMLTLNNTSSKTNDLIILNTTSTANALGALNSTTASLKTNINAVKTATDNVKSSVDSVKTVTDSVKSSVDSVKTATDNVKTAVDSVKTSVDANNAKTDISNGFLSSISNDIHSFLNPDAKQVTDSIDKSVADITNSTLKTTTLDFNSVVNSTKGFLTTNRTLPVITADVAPLGFTFVQDTSKLKSLFDILRLMLWIGVWIRVVWIIGR